MGKYIFGAVTDGDALLFGVERKKSFFCHKFMAQRDAKVKSEISLTNFWCENSYSHTSNTARYGSDIEK